MARNHWNGTPADQSERNARGRVSRRALVLLLSWVVAVLPASLPRAALAQEDPQQKAAAEALFKEGLALVHDRKYEAACRRFEQSQAVDPGLGTLLYLGDCYERVGRMASAWGIYKEARSVARAAGQADRGRVAQERANRVERSVSKLTVLVAAENRFDGLQVTINDKPLNAALFGVPLPYDAGRYELTARAPGRVAWSSEVAVSSGGSLKTVEVPPLATVSGEAPWAPMPETTAPAAHTDTLTTSSTSADAGAGFTPRQKTALIVAVSGVAVVGGGALMGLVARNKDDEAQDDCDAQGCLTRAAADLNEQARTWALGANVAYVVGGLALATGGILFVWPRSEPSSSAHRSPLRLSAALGAQGGMLSVRGEL